MNDAASALIPKARTERLIIKELPDETLVYDLDTDQAHCLNQTSGLVWKNCDGTRTATQVADCIETELGLKMPKEFVWLALEELEKFKLLTDSVSMPNRFTGTSRRDMIRTLSVGAAVAIPLITSIIAPTPAQAASCTAPTNRDNDCACTSSTQCTSGCCRSGLLQCKSGGGTCLP
jgi:hypothetical protein